MRRRDQPLSSTVTSTLIMIVNFNYVICLKCRRQHNFRVERYLNTPFRLNTSRYLGAVTTRTKVVILWESKITLVKTIFSVPPKVVGTTQTRNYKETTCSKSASHQRTTKQYINFKCKYRARYNVNNEKHESKPN